MADMNLGFGGSNPYVQNQAKALQTASNQNLQQNVLPGIGQGAQAAGMYGSSRQGTAEGIAMGNAQTGLDSATANLYSQAYGQDQNAQLQRDQMANQSSIASMQNDTNRLGINNNYALGNKQADNTYALGQGNLNLGFKQANNSYDLGLRNNDLGFGQLDANINQNNFNNNLAGANFGLGVYDRMNGYNQQGTANGTQMQNAPLNYFNQFNNNTMGSLGTGNGVYQGAKQGSELGSGLGAGLAAYGAMNGGTSSTDGAGALGSWSGWKV